MSMDTATDIPVHPVQNNGKRGREPSVVPQAVTLRAYECYKKVFGPQESLITGECRGGFGVNELIMFLYAMTFPKDEWRARVDEAAAGMRGV